MSTSADSSTADHDRDRAMLRRLSVFPGSFTLEAAYEVTSDHPIDTPGSHMWGRVPNHFPPSAWSVETAAAIRALEESGHLAHSQDQSGAQRWIVPAPIRAEAQAELLRTGELGELRRRHAQFMLAFVEAVEVRLWGIDYARYMPSLEADEPSLTAALTWAREAGETELGLRLATALWLYWQTRGRVTEGRRWLGEFLADRSIASELRAAGLTVASLLAWMQHDLDAADAMLTEALPVWRALGNVYGIGRALLFVGFVAWRRGDGAGMVASCEEAVRYFRDGNDLAGLPLSLIVLAVADHRLGADERALARLTEAAQLAELGGFAWGGAAARYYQGEVHAQRGELVAASSAYQTSLTTSWSLGDPWTTGAGIGGLATIAAMRGAAETAARLFGAADALCASAEAVLPVMDRGSYARIVAAASGAMGESDFMRAYHAGAALEPAAMVAEAERSLDLAPLKPEMPSRPNDASVIRLSRRELEVLRLVVEGQRDIDIAVALHLSLRTIHGYIRAMLGKFSVSSRTALAVHAVRRGLV